jgi:putative membrane protein insertion efficiency factor
VQTGEEGGNPRPTVSRTRRILTRPFTAMFVGCVRLYQLVLSPLLGNCCRFQPSCSVYCIEAVETHGLFKGGLMAIKRICRCHPFHPGGKDPVPEPQRAEQTQ